MTILARIQGRKAVSIVNLAALVEVVPQPNDSVTLYFSNNCMANGTAFSVSLEDIAGAIMDPVFGDDGIVDLMPPPVETEETDD